MIFDPTRKALPPPALRVAVTERFPVVPPPRTAPTTYAPKETPVKFIPIVSTLLLALTATTAQAGVRSYFAPSVDGFRLDSCLTSENDCGKPAADNFCKAKGYEHALLFQREAAPYTKRLGSGELCTGPDCASFRQIKCYSAAELANP